MKGHDVLVCNVFMENGWYGTNTRFVLKKATPEDKLSVYKSALKKAVKEAFKGKTGKNPHKDKYEPARIGNVYSAKESKLVDYVYCGMGPSLSYDRITWDTNHNAISEHMNIKE